MSEHKDEKWLDEQLQRAVDGVTPTFDAEAWKQKYAKEYEALLARSRQAGGRGKTSFTGWVLKSQFGKVAIAAAIVITASVLVVSRSGSTSVPPGPGSLSRAQPSPAQMVSMISLSAAFRRGGIDELDKQCDRALKKLGPRPNSVSMQELLREMNGKR